MKVGEIEHLLKQFYEGKTTEEQDEMLKVYLETAEVPEQFNVDKKILSDFSKIPAVEIPATLEEKLIRLIDEKAEEEKQFMVKSKTVIRWKWITSIAASILLLISLGYGITRLKDYNEPKDTFADPLEAYKAVQDALIEVSSQLNDGLAQFVEVRQDVNEISKEIIEEIE